MKNLYIIIIIAVIVAAGAFYGGMKYGQGKSLTPQSFQNMTQQQRQQLFANAGGGAPSGTRTGQGTSGFSAGQIIAKDDKSITIKMQDGSSKIVFYSNTTQVQKSTNGTSADLQIGQEVTANGTSNSDGSVTAQTIQIRPNVPSPNPNN